MYIQTKLVCLLWRIYCGDVFVNKVCLKSFCFSVGILLVRLKEILKLLSLCIFLQVTCLHVSCYMECGPWQIQCSLSTPAFFLRTGHTVLFVWFFLSLFLLFLILAVLTLCSTPLLPDWFSGRMSPPCKPGPAQRDFLLTTVLTWGSALGFCLCKAPRDNSYCKRCYANKVELIWIKFEVNVHEVLGKGQMNFEMSRKEFSNMCELLEKKRLDMTIMTYTVLLLWCCMECTIHVRCKLILPLFFKK